MAKGRIAGLNMAAEPVHTYDKGAPLNVTRLAGFKITIIGTVGSGKDSDLEGIARGDSETWRQLGEASIVESAERRRPHPARPGRQAPSWAPSSWATRPSRSPCRSSSRPAPTSAASWRVSRRRGLRWPSSCTVSGRTGRRSVA